MLKHTRRLALVVASTVAVGCQPGAGDPQPPQPLKPNVSQQASGGSTADAAGSQSAVTPPRSAAIGEPAETPVGPANDPPATVTPAGQAVPAEAAPAVAAENGLPVHTTPIWKPVVVLSAAHQNTCAVQVHEAFPPLDLQSLEGEAVELQAVLQEAFGSGNRMAVVVFWNSADAVAREQFIRLEEEVSGPFAKAGVTAIAVHVDGTADEASQVSPQPSDAVVKLIDPTGDAWAKVASAKLPRTYLLDSTGEIVWMDVEYSAGTRRDLRNALMYHLTGAADAAE